MILTLPCLFSITSLYNQLRVTVIQLHICRPAQVSVKFITAFLRQSIEYHMHHSAWFRDRFRPASLVASHKHAKRTRSRKHAEHTQQLRTQNM